MNRNRRFFYELTPFANALEKIQENTPAVARPRDDVAKIIAAQHKRERRMARNASASATQATLP